MRFSCQILQITRILTALLWAIVLPVWGQAQELTQVQTEGQPAQPNVLLIVAEDMSSRVGAFGDPVAQTPTLDRLASEGVRYTHVFSAAGVCAPNRSALITGMYPQSIGTQHMRTASRQYEAVPPAAVKAFPEWLRRAGYATANTAKTDYQFGEPFSIWDINNGGFNEVDLAVWRTLPDHKPFFAMINLTSTHESQLATAATQGAGRLGAFVEQIVSARAQRVDQVTDPAQVIVPPYYPNVPPVRASIAQHYDNIHYMDGQVAEILNNLEADDLADETIVIWTTDHGDGLPRAKRSIYDSGLRVPMIIRNPYRAPSMDTDARLISFVDIAPIILGLTNTPIPSHIQGRDLFSEDNLPRKYIHAGRDRLDGVPDWVRATRDERFKYIRNNLSELAYFRPLTFRDMFPVMQALWEAHKANHLQPAQRFYFTAPRPPEELYDTRLDPYEVNNLADVPEYADTLKRMRRAMDAWLSEAGDLSRTPEDQLIETMWPGGKQPVTAPPHFDVSVDGYLELASETPGASIGIRLASAPEATWQLYTHPVKPAAGQKFAAKAIRYGYRESPVVTIKAE